MPKNQEKSYISTANSPKYAFRLSDVLGAQGEHDRRQAQQKCYNQLLWPKRAGFLPGRGG